MNVPSTSAEALGTAREELGKALSSFDSLVRQKWGNIPQPGSKANAQADLEKTGTPYVCVATWDNMEGSVYVMEGDKTLRWRQQYGGHLYLYDGKNEKLFAFCQSGDQGKIELKNGEIQRLNGTTLEDREESSVDSTLDTTGDGVSEVLRGEVSGQSAIKKTTHFPETEELEAIEATRNLLNAAIKKLS